MNLWELFMWPMDESNMYNIDSLLRQMGYRRIDGPCEASESILKLIDETVHDNCGTWSTDEISAIGSWCDKVRGAMESYFAQQFSFSLLNESDSCGGDDSPHGCCQYHLLKWGTDAGESNIASAWDSAPFDIKRAHTARSDDVLVLGAFDSGSVLPLWKESAEAGTETAGNDCLQYLLIQPDTYMRNLEHTKVGCDVLVKRLGRIRH